MAIGFTERWGPVVEVPTVAIGFTEGPGGRDLVGLHGARCMGMEWPVHGSCCLASARPNMHIT